MPMLDSISVRKNSAISLPAQLIGLMAGAE